MSLPGATSQLSPKEARPLEEHRQRTAHRYCRGCGSHLRKTVARGELVATVLRYLRYDSMFGRRQEARDLYRALPAQARDFAAVDLAAAERACPYGLPVLDPVRAADRRLA